MNKTIFTEDTPVFDETFIDQPKNISDTVAEALGLDQEE